MKKTFHYLIYKTVTEGCYKKYVYHIIADYNKKHINQLIEELGMNHWYRRFKNHDDAMDYVMKDVISLRCNYIEGDIINLSKSY